MYWASLPTPVQALRFMNDDPPPPGPKGELLEGPRTSLAKQLLAQGFSIDVPIMVWNWDPLTTQSWRLQDGYTWVTAAGQPNIPIAPGLSEPGQPPYDPANPPAGSIKVSINPADYPPYAVPAVPAPPVSKALVGPVYNDGNPNDHIALMPASAQYRDGQTIEVGSITYLFVYKSVFSQPIWRAQPAAAAGTV